MRRCKEQIHKFAVYCGTNATACMPGASVNIRKSLSYGRRYAAVFAVLTLVLCTGPKEVKAAGEQNVTKEEVVYASLAADGKVDDIYVVNAFDLQEAGPVADYGEYSLVENLTDTRELEYKGSRVSTDADSGRFYYQGNLVSKELPWNVRVTYRLDGKVTPPSEMGGADGRVGITIHTSENPKTEALFYEKYMLQVTVTLDTSVCDHITAENATIANAGTDKQVTFTVMPEKAGKMEVNAAAADFYMKGISIAAVPFSAGADMLDLKEIDKLTEGLGELAEGIKELNGGADQLMSGVDAFQSGTAGLKAGAAQFGDGIRQLKDGADGLSSGAGLLQSGSGEFRSGLEQAAAGSDELLGGSAQVNQALQLLKGGTAELNSLDLAQLQALPDGLTALADGLEAIQAGYAGMFAAMDQVVNAYPVTEIPDAELYAALGELQQSENISPETQAVIGKLAGNYAAAAGLSQTYAGVRQSIEPLQESTAQVIQSMRDMAAGLGQLKDADPDSLKDLAGGIAGLSDQYAQFHQGLEDYLGGVKDLAGGYGQIDDGSRGVAEGSADLAGGMKQTEEGASKLLGGADALDSGAAALADGMSQLNGGLKVLRDQTSGMPDEVKKSIDEMLETYRNSDFIPVSFTSPENKNVKSVQFVFAADGIQKPKAAATQKEEAEKEGFWEKLLGLFKSR